MSGAPTHAVLVSVDGVERWCTRQMAARMQSGGETFESYIYAYFDLVTGCRYAQARCREIREGLVRVAVEEVGA